MRRLALLLLLAAAGCGGQDHPPIERVALKITVGSRVNYLEFDSSGFVRGGHVQGDSAPVVHEDTARIIPADASQIFALAGALGDTLLRHEGDAPAEPPGSEVLGILFANGSQARIVWPAGSEHPDARVRELVHRMLAHKVGGW